MDNIIGRHEEKRQLDRIFHSKEAEFVAVYGRRRVGKTYLIRQFFSDKPCLFLQVSGIIKAKAAVQLKEFKKAVEQTFYSHLKGTSLETPKNWMSALEMLHDAIKTFGTQKKVVLFFDEFPWLAIRKKQILQAIDYYWNQHWSSMPNIRLIICGSAASWIIKNILNNKAGLHNRVTLKLPIEPFSLHETQQYLKSKNIAYTPTQIAQLYMCLGGIPYYLRSIEARYSAMQNVNQLCFKKSGQLFNEFDNLFSSLFDHSEFHEAIIKLLAQSPQGVAREAIENHLQKKGGKLSMWLSELEHAGFIIAIKPWGKKRGIYYKIIDEYVLFYLRWISEFHDSLSQHEIDTHYWEEQAKTPAFQAWSGYAFEAVCFKHIAEIRTALSIPNGSIAASWQYRSKNPAESGTQIDLLFDRSDGVITLCEIKYSNQPYKITKEYAKKLQEKADIYQKVTKTTKQLVISMITTQGLAESIYNEDIIVSDATLKDLLNS